MDEINGNATRLLDFYGSEGLNKKFTQLMKEHPNFKDLSEEEQSTIIQEHFADFLDANPNFRMRMIF